jgi:hypothetical protein
MRSIRNNPVAEKLDLRPGRLDMPTLKGIVNGLEKEKEYRIPLIRRCDI